VQSIKLLTLIGVLMSVSADQAQPVCIVNPSNPQQCLGSVANPLNTSGGGGGGGNVNVTQWGSTNTSLGQNNMANSVPVAIASNQSNVPENLAAVGGSAISIGQATMANSLPVVIASNQSNLPENLTQVGGSALTLGQTTMANSIPVTFASNQSTLTVSSPATDTSASGNLNALNAAVTVAAAGQRGAACQFTTSTLNGTVVPEYSTDGGTTFFATMFFDQSQLNANASKPYVVNVVNPVAATSFFIVTVPGATHYRVRVSSFSSGTSAAVVAATSEVSPLASFHYVQGMVPRGGPAIDPVNPVVIGGVFSSQNGSVRNALIDTNGNLQFVGPVAPGSTGSSFNPVILGGVQPNGVVRVGTALQSGGVTFVPADPIPPQQDNVVGTGYGCTGAVAGTGAAQNLSTIINTTAGTFTRVTHVRVSAGGTASSAGVHLQRITASSGGTLQTNAQHAVVNDTITEAVRQSPTTVTTVAGDIAVIIAVNGTTDMLTTLGFQDTPVLRGSNTEGLLVSTDASTSGATFAVCFWWEHESN
jgi:hypothetical protein